MFPIRDLILTLWANDQQYFKSLANYASKQLYVVHWHLLNI